MSKRPKALLDTNLYIDYLGAGRHAELAEQRPLARYLSAIVHMELSAGAGSPAARRDVDALGADYAAVGRIIAPSAVSYAHAGRLLQTLRAAGAEVRRASFVNDLLIALTAREIGATVFTADGDFARIREAVEFDLEIVR